MSFIKICLIMCLLILHNAESLKILGLFPHPGKSHFDVFKPLLIKLAERGHDVTIIGHYPLEKKVPKYTDIILNVPPEGLLIDVIDMKMFDNPTMVQLLGPNLINMMGKISCESALSSKQFQNLYKSSQQFDIILSEFFNSNCMLVPFVHKLKIPFIGFTSHIVMPFNNKWVGNINNPAYVPNLFLSVSDQLTFLERVKNTLGWLYSEFYYKYGIESSDHEIIKKYVKGDVPHPSEVMSNTSLILSNSQFSLNRPRPLVPNVIEVGGIHITEGPKKLPTDIEKWMTESPHGVIYFSLGSMIKGHTFPEEKRQMFLNAFARLPQRVLWKWETEMPGQPKNVMIKKWMPQFDILNHPNVKAFISHGGLLGTTESVHCGVPMLVMPQFGDQFANARALEASGGGIMLDFTSLTEEHIYNSLKAVLDPDFNKKAKELSERFRDRPLPPMDTAIYWVEYVARHKGAPHMRTAAVGMPFYQYLLLDVIAFLAVISFVIFYIFYFVTKALFRKLFKSKSTPEKIKKN